MKKLHVILYNHRLHVPIINPDGREYNAVINAGLGNLPRRRIIGINRKVPYLRYLSLLIHEFGHLLIYVLLEDILDFKLENMNRRFFHKWWDFICSPDAFLQKSDTYMILYEPDTWEKKQKQKQKVVLM